MSAPLCQASLALGIKADSYPAGTTKSNAVATPGIPFYLEQSGVGALVGFGVDITFSAAPGTFSVLVQTSNTDADASYVTMDTITVVDSTNFNAHTDYSGIYASFVRLKASSIANTVTLQGSIRR